METNETSKTEKNDIDGYPRVVVHNRTKYIINVEVGYALCNSDSYDGLVPDGKTNFARGACLVNRVNATILTPTDIIRAKSYSSTGTAFSTYKVVEERPGVFEVSRY